MAGLTWFELDVDFHEDPKIKALVSRLRQPLADSYVSRLYAYCYKHAVDRFPPESAPDTIEDIARWKGRRSVLFDALFAVEVLERDAGKVVVHGVAARLGPHLAKKQTDAERQKRHREKVAASIGKARDVTPPVTRDVTPDVTRESRGNRDKDKDRDPNREAGSLAPRPVSPLVAFLRETYPDVTDPWACEASWSAAYPRVDLLAEAIKARAWEVSNPKNAKSHHARFLNAWFGRVKLPPVASKTHGDLGCEIHPWPSRLTQDEVRAFLVERRTVAPDLADAPLEASGPAGELTDLIAKYRAIAEERA